MHMWSRYPSTVPIRPADVSAEIPDPGQVVLDASEYILVPLLSHN
jgi:hypothetical protein